VDKFANLFLSKKDKAIKVEIEKIINSNISKLHIEFWHNIKTFCDQIIQTNESVIFDTL